MSPTQTKPPAQLQIIPQITIKPEPIDQPMGVKEHEQMQPLPAAVPNHIKLSEQVQKQSVQQTVKNDSRMDYHRSDSDEKPTDLSMDGPTDLSSGSRHVNIVCSPDPPLTGGGR